MNNLSKNTDIVIKTADKGGGIVILDKTYYMEEADNILANEDYYKILDSNPLTEHIASYTGLITAAYQDRVLDRKEKKIFYV